MNQATYHILPNGLTLLHLHVPRSLAAHFGVAVRAGSANENSPEEFGLAHFVEHTLFKGTAHRSSWHILNRMEAVGGELNAFTTKEDTVVYSSFPKGALSRSVELIVDLILNSRFPEKEIDKEREVICEEINSYLDSPADAVYDDFEDILYENTPLGHNILGTVESVRGIDSLMCRNWLQKHYYGANMIAFYAGPTALDTFLKKSESYLMLIPSGKREQKSGNIGIPDTKIFSEARIAETHQAHTVMGCRLPRLDIQERITLALTTNILGGPGMNSLLNIALRERRGLVYNVESSLSNWNDSTLFTTYFGTDPEDTKKCTDIVTRQIELLAHGGMTARKLAAAKKQYKGQLVLARQNVENRIIGIARATLLHGRALTAAETDKYLAAVTPTDLADMCSRLLPLSSLTLTAKLD